MTYRSLFFVLWAVGCGGPKFEVGLFGDDPKVESAIDGGVAAEWAPDPGHQARVAGLSSAPDSSGRAGVEDGGFGVDDAAPPSAGGAGVEDGGFGGRDAGDGGGSGGAAGGAGGAEGHPPGSCTPGNGEVGFVIDVSMCPDCDGLDVCCRDNGQCGCFYGVCAR